MMDENELESDDTEFVLTAAAYKKILGWMRFQVQVCELEHSADPDLCDDDTHQVAFLLAWIVIPVMRGLGISFDDDESGPLLDEIEV